MECIALGVPADQRFQRWIVDHAIELGNETWKTLVHAGVCECRGGDSSLNT